MQLLRSSTDASFQYRYFGGFRLVLAALVMLQHFAADLAPAPIAGMLAPYAMGSMAVLAFFALSGFVIIEAVDHVYRERPGAFLTNRLLRIVPHFILAVALSMVAHEVFRAADGVRLWRSQPLFPQDAFALTNMLINFIGIVPLADRFMHYNFLDITWAVRVEMAFYVIIFVCIAVARKIPGACSLPVTMTAVIFLLAPLFGLAVLGRGIGMLAFLPYFAFGGGLYFASTGRRTGWLITLLSVPAMIWQCVAELRTPGPIQAIPSSMQGSLIVLLALLSVMTMLAFATIAKGRSTDRTLGNLTYPLYLYHEDVLVVVLTFTTGYSYWVLAAGILLSLLTAMIFVALVDPLVTRFRDRVRGRSLDQDQSAFQDPAADGILRRSLRAR